MTSPPSAPALPGHERPAPPGQVHLSQRLQLVERRVYRAVSRRSESAKNSDPLSSLYVSASAVNDLFSRPVQPVAPDAAEDALLREAERQANRDAKEGAFLPLRTLTDQFSLTPLDVEMLLVIAAPDLDQRFERFFGFLHDDIAVRHATVGLVLQLAGLPALSGSARSALLDGPLLGHGLAAFVDDQRPVLTRQLRAEDRLIAFLLEQSAVPTAPSSISALLPAAARGTAQRLSELLEPGAVIYLNGRSASAADAIASHALELTGRPAFEVQLLAGEAEDALRERVLEARLRGGGVHAVVREMPSGADLCKSWPAATLLAEAGVPVVFTGSGVWQPAWTGRTPYTVDCPAVPLAERSEMWKSSLPEELCQDATAQAMAGFQLGPAQIARTVAAARTHAQAAGTGVDGAVLRAAARAQHSSGLEQLTRRIDPAVGWDDLVVPPLAMDQLHDLVVRARYREEVIGGWRMRPGGGRGMGVSALLSGESGTGKTLAAEVVAGGLGLDLYVINLATVVDKYIGETAKNLERIFEQAEGVNAVLLFDEADAVFGKRSDVKDAHDRYANTETAYLLQRLEAFDGVVLLTTNLYANIDSAFLRRLDLVIDFPMPEPLLREQLWDRCLGDKAPRAADLDLGWLANRFELSGGSIRCCAVTAAYRCAERKRPIGTRDLAEAVRTEYRKLGRVIDGERFFLPQELP